MLDSKNIFSYGSKQKAAEILAREIKQARWTAKHAPASLTEEQKALIEKKKPTTR